jgi:phage shock protein E
MQLPRLLLLAALTGFTPLFPPMPTRAAEAAADAKAAVKNITVDEAEKLVAGKGAPTVLDVRTAKEFADGHIADARNLDFYQKDFADQLARLDKSGRYVVICASGGRSAKACGQLAGLGFTNVINVEGGMKAWEKAGKPVVK